MSNLDVYCVFHFDEKKLFAHMGKLGLSFDPKKAIFVKVRLLAVSFLSSTRG